MTASPRRKRANPPLIERSDDVRRAPLGGSDQRVVRDADRVERGFDLAPPQA